MRDVDNGYILRYTHANVASFFFIFVYALKYKNFSINNFKLAQQQYKNFTLILSATLRRLRVQKKINKNSYRILYKIYYSVEHLF